MNARDATFSKIRTALGDVKAKADYPDYDPAVLHSKPRLEGTPREAFTRNFTAVSGKVIGSVAELAAYLQQNGQTRGYCDPALMAEATDAEVRKRGAGFLHIICELKKRVSP